MTSREHEAKPPTFRVLGPLSVWDGRGYQPLPASKPASMLAALLTSPNEVTSNDFLLRAVWGDEVDVEAKSALRTCTTRLRKLLVRHNLGEDLIQTVSGGYRLRAGGDDLDLLLFRERVVGSTRLDGIEPQVEALREAIDLWQGSVLCNIGSDVLHRGVVPLLEEERLQVLERIVDLLVRDGRDQEALAELQSLTRSHEGHERFALQLVGVLSRSGRREDALAECTRIKQYLADELGLDPTPELAAAEMSILTGQPTDGESAVDGPTHDGPTHDRPDQEGKPEPGTERLGNVRYLRPPAPARTTPQPVRGPLHGRSGFVGREDEVEHLVRQFRGADGFRSMCLLLGPPGVGKTSLALHVAACAAELRSDIPGQAMLRMRDESDRPRALDDLLAELSAPPASAAETGLLLLDDAFDERHVVAIADAFPHRSILVTTGAPMLRLVRTHGALVHRLGALSTADALAMLSRLLGPAVVAEDMLAAYEIVTQCWRNPLALRVLAATLQTRPSWSLSTAASWLGEDPVARLSGGSGDLSLAVYFDLALLRLAPPLPEVLTSVSRIDADDFSLADARELLGEQFTRAHLHLHDLVDRGWVDELAPGRFRVDPFVRALARRVSPPVRAPGDPEATAPDPLHPPKELDPVGSAGPSRLDLPQEGAR